MQIIEARFGIVIIPSIANRVTGDEAGCACSTPVCVGNGDIAPGVIVVVADDGFCVGDCSRGRVGGGYDTEDALHVTLCVGCVEVGVVVCATVGGVGDGKWLAQFIIDEVHDDSCIPVGEGFTHDLAVERCVGMRYAVNNFLCTNAIQVIRIVVGLASRGDACKLSALSPRQVGIRLYTISIGQGIAACVIAQVISRVANLDGHQLVFPVTRAVGVGFCRACRAYGLRLLKEVACGIVFVGIGRCDVRGGVARAVVVDLGGKLILVIIGVGNQQIIRACALTNFGDIPECIIGILVARDKSAVGVALVVALSTRQGCAFRCAALFCDGLAERKGVNRRQHTEPSPVLCVTLSCGWRGRFSNTENRPLCYAWAHQGCRALRDTVIRFCKFLEAV